MAERARHDLRIEVQDLEDGGKVSVLDRWERFTVETDFFSGKTMFNATLADSEKHRNLFARGGDTVKIYNHGALVLTGIVDEASDDVSPSSSNFQIAGRDMSSFLMDSDLPPDLWNINGLTLRAVAKKWTEPWRKWIPEVVTDHAPSRYVAMGGASRSVSLAGRGGKLDGKSRTTHWAPGVSSQGTNRYGKNSPGYAGIDQGTLRNKVGPGMKVWATLKKFAKQCACHIAMTVDGKLWIGRPRYDQNPNVYGRGLVLRWDFEEGRAKPKGDSNCRGLRYQSSIAGRNSEILVIGQGGSKKTAQGRALLKRKWSAKDPSPAFWERTIDSLGARRLYKPRVMKVKRVDDDRLVRRIARTEMEDKLLQGFDFSVRFDSHAAETGALWAVETMVSVLDDRHLIEDVYMISKVSRQYEARGGGETCNISLLPRDIWLATDHETVLDPEYEAKLIPLTNW